MIFKLKSIQVVLCTYFDVKSIFSYKNFKFGIKYFTLKLFIIIILLNYNIYQKITRNKVEKA